MPLTEVTESNFSEQVENSELPVLLDFSATWCGPCKMIAPLLDEISTSYEGKAKLVKIDIDTNQSLAQKYQVSHVPTLIFLNKNGEVSNSITGVTSKGNLTAELDKLIG